MAGPHQPSGLPDADLPHQKYMYVCMYVCRGMISQSKVQMFSYDQLFQAYQKDKFVLVSCYR